MVHFAVSTLCVLSRIGAIRPPFVVADCTAALAQQYAAADCTAGGLQVPDSSTGVAGVVCDDAAQCSFVAANCTASVQYQVQVPGRWVWFVLMLHQPNIVAADCSVGGRGVSSIRAVDVILIQKSIHLWCPGCDQLPAVGCALRTLSCLRTVLVTCCIQIAFAVHTYGGHPVSCCMLHVGAFQHVLSGCRLCCCLAPAAVCRACDRHAFSLIRCKFKVLADMWYAGGCAWAVW